MCLTSEIFFHRRPGKMFPLQLAVLLSSEKWSTSHHWGAFEYPGNKVRKNHTNKSPQKSLDDWELSTNAPSLCKCNAPTHLILSLTHKYTF